MLECTMEQDYSLLAAPYNVFIMRHDSPLAHPHVIAFHTLKLMITFEDCITYVYVNLQYSLISQVTKQAICS